MTYSRLALVEAAADVGLGRRYGHTGDDTQDCVRLALATLERLYPTAPWTTQHRRDVLIVDRARPWSGIPAVESLGLGKQVAAPIQGHWHLCQGWHGLVDGKAVKGSSGHCWLWWGGLTDDPPKVLEATNAGPDWYRPDDWARRIRSYDEVRLAVLFYPR